tara:strand:- start:796 stop:984 length:189 start_codon:yes stop_codon:yes gene_type:complete
MTFTDEHLKIIKWLLERESNHIKEIYNVMLKNDSSTAEHIEEVTNRLSEVNEIIKLIEKEQG